MKSALFAWIAAMSSKMRSKAALDRFDKLHALGCICCRKRGYEQHRIEIHHVVDKSYRKGDMATLPLCSWHHRDEPLFGWTKTETRELLGPSLRGQKKKFIEKWGGELQLLKEVNEMLA